MRPTAWAQAAEEAQVLLDQLDDGESTMVRRHHAAVDAHLLGLREATSAEQAQDFLDGWDPTRPAPKAATADLMHGGRGASSDPKRDALSDLMDSEEAQELDAAH